MTGLLTFTNSADSLQMAKGLEDPLLDATVIHESLCMLDSTRYKEGIEQS